VLRKSQDFFAHCVDNSDMYFDVRVFGVRLKELRDEKGITTIQLGEALGVTCATISRWENGLINPTVDSIFRIAKYFHVPAGYLIGTEEL